MKKELALIFLITIFMPMQVFAAGLKFNPISRASLLIEADNTAIYVVPVGELSEYADYKKADFILITHTHRDHLAPDLVKSLKDKNTIVIGPQAVINELGFGQVMNNNEMKTFGSIKVETIPMYNTTKERMKFHKKGEGNGYVITINGIRGYISGDTEDIPEMRNMKKIGHAFICMNLPYAMTPEQAASAVLDFKPRFVYPYHYRGQNGFGDIRKLKKLTSSNKGITVVSLKWHQ